MYLYRIMHIYLCIYKWKILWMQLQIKNNCGFELSTIPAMYIQLEDGENWVSVFLFPVWFVWDRSNYQPRSSRLLAYRYMDLPTILGIWNGYMLWDIQPIWYVCSYVLGGMASLMFFLVSYGQFYDEIVPPPVFKVFLTIFKQINKVKNKQSFPRHTKSKTCETCESFGPFLAVYSLSSKSLYSHFVAPSSGGYVPMGAIRSRTFSTWWLSNHEAQNLRGKALGCDENGMASLQWMISVDSCRLDRDFSLNFSSCFLWCWPHLDRSTTAESSTSRTCHLQVLANLAHFWTFRERNSSYNPKFVSISPKCKG